jgi:hypothetical protein
MPFHVDFNNFNPGGYQSGNAGGFTPPPRKARKPRKAIGSAAVRTLINLLVTAVFGLLYYYAELPALNFQAEEFYVFIFLLCAVYCVSAALTSGFQAQGARGYFQFARKQCTVPLLRGGGPAGGDRPGGHLLLGGAAGGKLQQAADHFGPGTSPPTSRRSPTIRSPCWTRTPPQRLGNRKLGELSDMVSQFEVMDNYTQINYQGRPVRVTSLRYGDIIKWLNNRRDGLPAYLIIDMTTQNVEVVRLEGGDEVHHGGALQPQPVPLSALPLSHLSVQRARPLRSTRRAIPYWVCPRIVKTIGLFGGTDIRGGAGERRHRRERVLRGRARLGGPGLRPRISSCSSTTTTASIINGFSTPSSASGT